MTVDVIVRRLFCIVATVCLSLLLIASMMHHAKASDMAVREFQRAAYGADFSRGIENLRAIATADPSDVEAVFATGALQFFHALANLQESFFSYGGGKGVSGSGLGWMRPFGRSRRSLGKFTLLPPNPNARPMTYQTLRNIFQRFATDLSVAERTLALVGERPVKLPLQPFKIAIDLNHDGKVVAAESLLGVMLAGMPPGRRSSRRQEMRDATVAFDTADASWLRGYCNLLMASANFALAFDFEKSYDTTAHAAYGPEATEFGRELLRQAPPRRDPVLIQAELDKVSADLAAFQILQSDKRKLQALRKQLRALARKPETKEERLLLTEELRRLNAERSRYYKKRGELTQEQRQLRDEKAGKLPGDTFAWIADVVAYVHTMNWAVIEPDRLKAMHKQLLRVMELNKATWRLVRSETDDDREWLPSAVQTTPFGGRRLTDKIIDGWLATMALGEQVLKGEKLLPHPRFKMGINLKKFFMTVKQVDFVLLITGHDALPYLEAGDVVDRKAWAAITRPLRGNFPLYAIWFN